MKPFLKSSFYNEDISKNLASYRMRILRWVALLKLVTQKVRQSPSWYHYRSVERIQKIVTQWLYNNRQANLQAFCNKCRLRCSSTPVFQLNIIYTELLDSSTDGIVVLCWHTCSQVIQHLCSDVGTCVR